jgi:cytochrome P450
MKSEQPGEHIGYVEAHDILAAEMKGRRAPGARARADVLSLLVAARDEDGRPMPDDDLRDQMMTLLLAGHRFPGARPGPYGFLPFGGGVRRCLGMAFALYEMKVVLARVLSRVELRVVPGYRAQPVRRSVTLAPSRGMPVEVAARVA